MQLSRSFLPLVYFYLICRFIKIKIKEQNDFIAKAIVERKVINNTKILQSICKKKPQTLLTNGLKRITSRNPYESIDLIEYYKSYNKHNELGRGRQALESAKVNFFIFDFLQFLRSFPTNSDLLSRMVLVSSRWLAWLLE